MSLLFGSQSSQKDRICCRLGRFFFQIPKFWGRVQESSLCFLDHIAEISFRCSNGYFWFIPSDEHGMSNVRIFVLNFPLSICSREKQPHHWLIQYIWGVWWSGRHFSVFLLSGSAFIGISHGLNLWIEVIICLRILIVRCVGSLCKIYQFFHHSLSPTYQPIRIIHCDRLGLYHAEVAYSHIFLSILAHLNHFPNNHNP